MSLFFNSPPLSLSLTLSLPLFRAAGTSTPASKKKEWGVFDLFTQEPDESSGGDQYEPRDPNSLTARESKDYGFDGDLGEGGMAYRAPPSAMPKSVAVAKKAPAPAPIQAPVKAAAPSTPAPSAPTGGFFGFLTPKEETKGNIVVVYERHFSQIIMH
jgi:hypothetical protein